MGKRKRLGDDGELVDVDDYAEVKENTLYDWATKFFLPIILAIIGVGGIGFVVIIIIYPPSIPNQVAIATQTPNPIDEVVMTSLPPRECRSWESCWEYDHIKQTLTWLGNRTGNVSIGEEGQSMQYILDGYTAIFTTDIQLKVCLCDAYLNNEFVECHNQPVYVEPGTYIYYTTNQTGETGGFSAHSNFDYLCPNE